MLSKQTVLSEKICLNLNMPYEQARQSLLLTLELDEAPISAMGYNNSPLLRGQITSSSDDHIEFHANYGNTGPASVAGELQRQGEACTLTIWSKRVNIQNQLYFSLLCAIIATILLIFFPERSVSAIALGSLAVFLLWKISNTLVQTSSIRSHFLSIYQTTLDVQRNINK
ncbi:hypothetical protein [Persicirhabdus sediminis]|uniref:Uncharacterized protein n=1 Tax=Persicirhabdus sediminis TaxID=454144 RepID=A0A8J7SII8_9BACT|nr:hypothetical protein [Persicirhabdus sediminis]MBK1790634.1 hypothetical protein [Persicirhabdus sediminis]